MVPAEESYNNTPVINTEKLEELISFYKFPLILGLTGIILIIVTIGLLIKGKSSSPDVVFQQAATPSSQVNIRLDIEGAVLKPGVYTLPPDSRIADALSSAGGLSADADRDWVAKNLNRAARLSDGAKIYIPNDTELSSGKLSSLPAEASAKAGLSNISDLSNIAGVTSKTVNINSASNAELEALPGVGPVTAGKIISGRPYQAVNELKSRKIIGNSLYDKLKDSLSVY